MTDANAATEGRLVASAPRSLHAAALETFLARPELYGPDGRVLSWVATDSSAYAYDEATAIFARLHAWLGRAAHAVALGQVLDRRIRESRWLGRSGVSYAFDTALALPSLTDPEPVVRRLVGWLTGRKVCDPVARPGWWSESWGAHIIKALVPLAALGRRELAEALAADIVDTCFDGERFRIHPESGWTYLHSHCYAVEGLLGLRLRPDVVSAASAWLARVQADDGSLPAWEGRYTPERPADVVAQAVRIWCATDPDAYAEPISRAMDFLAVRQDPATGGIVYAAGSGHLTSWVAAFALQAHRWSCRSPGPSELKWLL